MLTLAAWCLLATIPYEAATTDTFDVCHLQHVHDNEANHVFSQLLWKRWNAYDNRYDIEAWRIVKPDAQNILDGEVLFHDGGVLRRVRHHRFVETFDQYDEELRQRELKDKDHRKELSKPLRK
jgi:hypothetical protein